MSERIVIAGGGAIGCSIAYFLSLQKTPGREIWVIEKDPTYQIASSSLSASSIRQQFSTPICIQLSQFGYDFFFSCEREKARYGAGVDLVDLAICSWAMRSRRACYVGGARSPDR